MAMRQTQVDLDPAAWTLQGFPFGVAPPSSHRLLPVTGKTPRALSAEVRR